MVFPDEEAKLDAGRISDQERLMILEVIGQMAQAKYDEFVVRNTESYNLSVLRGSLQFESNIHTFENDYYLESKDEHWTKIANYFEYGTGLYNQKRAGKYRAGYIKPVIAKYMKFVTKDGNFVSTKKVKGVKPIFAMEKAKKFIEFNRKRIQREIRLEFRANG